MSALADLDLLDVLGQGIPLIDPFDRSMLQPASIDVRLQGMFVKYPKGVVLDSRYPIVSGMREIPFTEYTLQPGEFVLGSTVEVVLARPRGVIIGGRVCGLQAELCGKSSRGRLGLLIHATAGFVDPGFHAQVTLEISNINRENPIQLYAGMVIGQVQWSTLSREPGVAYGEPGSGSHYQGQKGPTAFRA